MAVIRFALYVDLMLLFGLPAFLIYNACEAATLEARFARILRALAILGPLISILGFAVLCADMAGLALTDLDRATVEAILWQTPIGMALAARITVLFVYLATLLRPGPLQSMRSFTLITAGGIALGTLAWTGHGAAGSWTRLVADIIHLLSAGLWVGALAAFALLLMCICGSNQSPSLLAIMIARFSVVGSLAVFAIVASGLVNTWELVGPEHAMKLWNSPFGQVLTVKLTAFLAMLGLAAVNRFRLTPRLERSLTNAHCEEAIFSLRRSVAIEAAIALTVLGLVAYLGLLEPPRATM